MIQGQVVLDPVTMNPGAQEPVESPSRFFRGLLVAIVTSGPVWAALIWAVTSVV
jgi:hypothetical protein